MQTALPLPPRPPPAFTPSARLLALAERLTRTISVARALTLARREVDLAGLEDGVGMLCAQSLELGPEERREILPALAELLAQLDALGAALTGARDA